MYRPIVRSIRLKRMYHTMLGNRFIEGAHYLVATSDSEKQDLVVGGVDAARVSVRRNGVELPANLPPRGEFRRANGISTEAKLVLFLGRLVSKKSPDMLLEAFGQWRERSARSQDAVLVLAGPDEGDGFLPKLKSIVDRLGLRDRVLFPGPLYDDAKWSAYCDADVFILPSQNENFGNTAGEAAACGTPVIVTDRCGIAPFVGHAGEVIPHNLAALQNMMGTFLEDPMLRQNRAEGCREFVDRLSWDGPLDQSEAMYRECVAAETVR
jgi:glycosyltransferase involved in cell wall biosynthesis